MERYENGKIYKLIFPNNYYYYGSTCIDLAKRLYYHKCKHYKEKSLVYQEWRKVGRNAVTIELVENYSCTNKRELEKRENEFILSSFKDEYCLNSKMAIEDPLSWKVYRESHREQHRAAARKYYWKKKIELIDKNGN